MHACELTYDMFQTPLSSTFHVSISVSLKMNK